jgi:uncharacterized protein
MANPLEREEMTMGSHPRADSAPAEPVDRAGLAALLGKVPQPHAMSLEALDGLFCALVAGQTMVGPTAYLPVVLGGDPRSRDTLANFTDPGALISRIVRYRDGVAADFEFKGVHLPHVEPGGAGAVPGRAWARGFMRGIKLTRTGWGELFADERQGELLVIALVAGELDANWPRAPLNRETQDDLVNQMAVAAARSYRHFNAV